ncbi:DOPA 4,5-dioxygenase [Rhizoctonia solani]|uniref:DOPA 4,5-dioxygenase n=1 Tax=Rhizoctonia solani TaxID=456999 RepID=A0A8H8PAR2_9AGAM|nr:DOPA 4,5-dioxygenase [Rhizoctonia solani]QRW26858.1 DOPA 4,5-dioxygenase [Rhizoctonia solani]
MQITIKQAIQPPTDVERVLEEEIQEWHFHIYFLQRNAAQHAAALALRDAILRLRRDGAFVAVPLYRVNTAPVGPHPAVPFAQYVILIAGVGIFAHHHRPTIEERKVAGRKIEETLRGDREAAPAPTEG